MILLLMILLCYLTKYICIISLLGIVIDYIAVLKYFTTALRCFT